MCIVVVAVAAAAVVVVAAAVVRRRGGTKPRPSSVRASLERAIGRTILCGTSFVSGHSYHFFPRGFFSEKNPQGIAEKKTVPQVPGDG